MKIDNEMTLTFKSKSINEGFARSVVAAFCVQLNPTIDEIADIKTAVSEAVTNCVVHAYPETEGLITLNVKIKSNTIIITISDNGIGINNIDKAREPFFTTKPEQERSGMGFTVMESFMDDIKVERNKHTGITVTLQKRINSARIKKVLGV